MGSAPALFFNKAAALDCGAPQLAMLSILSSDATLSFEVSTC
jgi:hypothetical protein